MINAGDTAWILASAALVLLMTSEGGTSYQSATQIGSGKLAS